MPTPSYSNKDLARFDRTPGNYTEYGPVTYADGSPEGESLSGVDFQSADDLLSQAHAALNHANALDESTGASDIASIPERMAALSQQNQQQNASRTHLRDITEPLAKYGAYGELASIPAAMAGVTAPAAPFLAAGGALAQVPDIARRLISPDEGESRLGAVAQAGLMASPFALKGIKNALAGTAVDEAFQSAKGAANKFWTGHPGASSPHMGSVMQEADAAREAEAASRAGEASKMRYTARQAEAAGVSPQDFYTQSGMNPESGAYASEGFHPNAPRSISTASPISHSTPHDYIGNLMDELASQDAAAAYKGGAAQNMGNAGIDDLAGASQGALTARRYPSVTPTAQPPAALKGIMDALKTTPEDLSQFEQGPAIRAAQGSRTPEQAALFNRGVGESAPESTAKVSNQPRTTTNASGESMASQEAMNRQASMKAKGEQFVVMDRSGKMRPLIGPEAVDYQPRPGEKYGTFSQHGFKLLQEGGKRGAR